MCNAYLFPFFSSLHIILRLLVDRAGVVRRQEAALGMPLLVVVSKKCMQGPASAHKPDVCGRDQDRNEKQRAHEG
jgi:hypothetical protein